MKLYELSPAPGSVTAPKRKGRGIGTGNGKTAGRGHKGQNARSGGGVRPRALMELPFRISESFRSAALRIILRPIMLRSMWLPFPALKAAPRLTQSL